MPTTPSCTFDHVGFRAVLLIAVLAVLAPGCELVFPPGGQAPDAPPDLRHDEDHDLLVDAVDPCPHIAGDNADDDLDGVGDLCDPALGDPRQHITYFNGFGGDLDGLIAGGATSFDQDDLVVLGSTVDVTAIYLPVALAHANLATHVRVASEDTTALVVDAMLVAGHPPDPATFIGSSCRLGRSGVSSTDVQLSLHYRASESSDQTISSTAITGTPLLGFEADVTMGFDVLAMHADCDFGGTVFGGTMPTVPGNVGMVARRVDARFAYLLVIDTND